MELRTSIYENGFTLCYQKILDEGCQRNDFIEQSVFFEGREFGKIADNQVVAGAFLINDVTVTAKKEFALEMLTDEDAYQLVFLSDKSSPMMYQYIRSLSSGTHIIKVNKAAAFELLMITIPKFTFETLVKSFNFNYAIPGISEEDNVANILNYGLMMTPEMETIMKQIVNCEKTGQFKRMYLEAKVYELLALQLEYLYLKPLNYSHISATDVERMHEAKSIIVNNVATPCSLIDLAKMVGTNEFKLKKYFKEIFGTTVFGYWNDLKMNNAKEKLMNEELNISEIAESLGYKSSNHFSTAFRKYFGHTPSELKRTSLTQKSPTDTKDN